MARSPVRTALTAGALLASPAVTLPVVLTLTVPGLASTVPDSTAAVLTSTVFLVLAVLLLPAAGVVVLATGSSPRRGPWAGLAAVCLVATAVGLLVGSLTPEPLAYAGGWLALGALAALSVLGGGLLIGGAVAALAGRTG